MPNKLQYVELPIIGRETCQANYNGINGVTDGENKDIKINVIVQELNNKNLNYI